MSHSIFCSFLTPLYVCESEWVSMCEREKRERVCFCKVLLTNWFSGSCFLSIPGKKRGNETSQISIPIHNLTKRQEQEVAGDTSIMLNPPPFFCWCCCIISYLFLTAWTGKVIKKKQNKQNISKLHFGWFSTRKVQFLNEDRCERFSVKLANFSPSLLEISLHFSKSCAFTCLFSS